MIFITVSQRGHTDSVKLLGPFNSVAEAKRKVTDNITRGIDGDETRYTFFETNNAERANESGYILFYEEYEQSGLEWKKEEKFYCWKDINFSNV